MSGSEGDVGTPTPQKDLFSNKAKTQRFEISQESPYTEYQRGGVTRNEDKFNNLRSPHYVPTYSNPSSPTRPNRFNGREKTPKYGVCACLSCNPAMAGLATFASVVLVAAYFYAEYGYGGVFTSELAEDVVDPQDLVDTAVAEDAVIAFIGYAALSAVCVLLDLALGFTSCCQSTAGVEDDAKRCAAGVAVAATLGFLVDLGLMAAASYCALLIQGFELPVPQDGAYDWVVQLGQGFLYGSSAALVLHIACMIMAGQHARKIQHAYNSHSYLSNIATTGHAAQTE